MRVIKRYIIPIIALYIILDISGFMLWALSGQQAPKGYYIGKVTELTLSTLIK